MTFIAWARRIATPVPWPARWQDRIFTDHWSFGSRRPFGWRFVIYGANAMHWALNVRLREGGPYWCFHPRTRTFGGRWPAYFYISRDATPQGARWMWGRDE